MRSKSHLPLLTGQVVKARMGSRCVPVVLFVFARFVGWTTLGRLHAAWLDPTCRMQQPSLTGRRAPLQPADPSLPPRLPQCAAPCQ